ncbi:hypothetical protein QZH41_020300, partial [Actinostola sp. cb2023]
VKSIIFFSPRIKKLLSSGTSIITDRYAFSGVAFTAAKVIDASQSVEKIHQQIKDSIVNAQKSITNNNTVKELWTK